MPRILLMVWLAVTVVAAGCDGSPFGSPRITHTGGGCSGDQQGVIVLAWTIGGAAPSSTSCSGIDHLALNLDGQGCSVTVEPIPCALDHWRYDGLPEGAGQATLTAISSAGATVATGTQAVDLTPAVPPTPTPLDLQ